MFPLDDIFVFGDIFFSWLIFFFLAFAIGFKFTGGRRRHGEEPAGPEGRSGGRREARSAERSPERSPEGPAGSSPCRRRPPVNLKPMAKVNKKKYSAKTKKNTHQQTKILILRKHQYTYDIVFFC